MKKLTIPQIVLSLILGLGFLSLQGQVNNPYQSYFDEAYRLYPSIPPGLLESVAFNNTRMNHLTSDAGKPSCQGIPKYIGVMGLIEDGKGYFNNTLGMVARNSQFSSSEIKSDPRINILAYAEAYSNLQRRRSMFSQNMATQGSVVGDLSEIPNDNSELNRFARDQQFFSILKEMENPHTGRKPLNSQRFNYQEIFGTNQYQLLTIPSVEIRVERNRVSNFNASPFRCTSEERQADYIGAVWQAANTRNYGSRGGKPIEHITIHTIQGTYASAISWFKNPNARVSTHYVIRASDGQVTQMVCESDKAFHVKTDNATSIGIEHEGYIDEGASWYTQEMYESSAKLVRDLAARHGIDPSLAFSGPATDGIRTLSNACYRIKGHQHFRDNNHIDPGPYWDWERYYNLINGPPEVQEISDSQGTIKVLNYEANERKAYLINPPGNSPVRLTFKQFDLEWDSRRKEPFDFLDIYDGADAKGRPLGRFTGPEAPRGLVANSGKVFLEFRSDCRTSGKGFDLNFSTENVDINCRPMVSARVQSTFALGATVGWTASGSGQYVVKVRRRGSTSAWSQFQTRETSFQLTGLAANTPYEWAVHSVCDNDNISAPVGGNFTTRSVSRAGSPKVYVVNSPEGKFLDSGGELNSYANNEAYIYSIRPKGAGPIQVTFSEFNTEEDFDFLSVYDGPSPEDRLIGNFSGTNIPATLSSTGNSLTFRFVSDNRTQNSGWKASWKQQVPSGPSPEDPDGPDVVILPDNSKLSPTLKFPNRRPESSALMDPSYSASPIKVNFKDEASTGRAPAFRFYSVVQQEGSEWAAQPQRGFLWENFTQTLDENWEVVNGQWLVQNDQLVQADLQDGNTNIWTELNQAKGETYLYHWLARMEGESNNRRMGLHFFVSDPNLKQRGNSYFVWFRDADAGGKAEIYRTTNDRFEVKAKKKFNFSPGVAYDFKVIFQQSKGRIEVYINNEFVVSWNDPRPFSSGKAISFRTGNTLCTFDDLRVYKARSSSVSLAVDQEGKGDIVPGRIGRGGLRFRVFSAITNSTTREKARWSAISMMESRYFPSSDNTPSEEDPEIPDSQSGISLRPYYSDDFIVNLSSTGYFMIPTFYDRKLWSSAPNLGYFFDEFSGNKFRDDWILGEGKWKLRGGRLSQEEAAASNTNVSTLVTQTGGFVYLYHWKARLMTTGENKRFGIHFFASDGTQVNRGDSYMIWFRNYDKEQDQVEVYKSFDDDLREPLAKSPFVINPNTWYDFKVYFDSGLGIVRVFLDDEQVLSWQDLSTPYAKGAYVSLRTGNSAVQFDNFRVYRQQASKEPNITVGNSNFDMIRFQPSAKDRKVSLYFLRLGENGKWESEIKVNTEIR